MAVSTDNSFTAGTVIEPGEMNTNFTTHLAGINQNFEIYRTILSAGGGVQADLAAGTYPLGHSITVTVASGSDFQAATDQIDLIYFDDADYDATSETVVMRVRAQVSNNATAWSTVTATFGLYTVAFAGGNDAITATLTLVSNSTVALANPGASATAQGNSGDFTIPADNQLCLGVVTSAQLTNNSSAILSAQLQIRNT